MSESIPGRSASALPDRVLIAVDSTTASEHALVYAKGMIAPGGRVRLVSVAENPRTLMPMGAFASEVLASAHEELLRDANEALTRAYAALADSGFQIETEAIDLSKHGSDVTHALMDAARNWQAQLLVVGARQHHGLLRWIEGSVSTPLASLAQCPVLIVPVAYRTDALLSPGRILFAVDASSQATEALRKGLQFATHTTAGRAIYVIDRAVRLGDFVPIDVLENAFVEEGTRVLAAVEPLVADRCGQASTALVETKRTSDDVAHAIVREAHDWRADLLVMGTHGRRGPSRWILGSVAERVARLTDLPLLLVHTQADAG
ncbi:universal stress protein [Trinickia diaoshuihuensis]|uniref:universal stress protein n=1 Tax=Trinickia diaoshuihuensis TaxID=2292265 RepID=UPI000E2887EF|nr:universal stress protein [Trinickia diaoshuihuensis]